MIKYMDVVFFSLLLLVGLAVSVVYLEDYGVYVAVSFFVIFILMSVLMPRFFSFLDKKDREREKAMRETRKETK